MTHTLRLLTFCLTLAPSASMAADPFQTIINSTSFVNGQGKLTGAQIQSAFQAAHDALTNLDAGSFTTGTLPVGRLPAGTGDVTRPAGSDVNTIAPGAVTAAKIAPLTLTGASAARPLLDKLTDQGYSVLDFGAKCDGSTNDGLAIQAAISASASLGVQLIAVPRGRTCLANIKTVSNLHARIDGLLKTATLGLNAITNTGNDTNVVLEGDGVIDNGYPASGPAPSATAPVGCINTYGQTQYWHVTGLTFQNCGNWPVNVVGLSSTPGGGAAHIYFDHVKALGAGNRNSFEYADGCDDCWLDDSLIDGLVADIGFSPYGNNTNGGARRNRINNTAIGIQVLSDGDARTALNAIPSSNELIEGNEITGSAGPCMQIHNGSSNNTGAVPPQKAIRIIGNDCHGNNTSLIPNNGGLTVIEGDGVISMGNFYHDDGVAGANGANTATPTAGIYLYAAATHFTSSADTIYNEGVKGVGIAVVITTGAVSPAFYATRIYDNQSTPTMAQGFAGSCAADCTITGAKIDKTNVTNPFGALSLSPLAVFSDNSPSVAWFTYVPTLGCGAGTLTSASASARYTIRNKVVSLAVVISITTNGSCAGTIVFTLPPGVSPVSGSFAGITGRENAVGGKTVTAFASGSQASMQVVNVDNSYPGGNGAVIGLNGTFETN